jgi:hypothetical protein
VRSGDTLSTARREYYGALEAVSAARPDEAAVVDRYVRVLAERAWRLQERAQRAEGVPLRFEGQKAETRAAYRQQQVAAVCEVAGVDRVAADLVVSRLMPELDELDPAPFWPASAPPPNEVRVENRRQLTERADLVEKTLMAVWRWSTFDGVNVEALRKILKRADPDAAVHAMR